MSEEKPKPSGGLFGGLSQLLVTFNQTVTNIVNATRPKPK